MDRIRFDSRNEYYAAELLRLEALTQAYLQELASKATPSAPTRARASPEIEVAGGPAQLGDDEPLNVDDDEPPTFPHEEPQTHPPERPTPAEQSAPHQTVESDDDDSSLSSPPPSPAKTPATIASAARRVSYRGLANTAAQRRSYSKMSNATPASLPSAPKKVKTAKAEDVPLTISHVRLRKVSADTRDPWLSVDDLSKTQRANLDKWIEMLLSKDSWKTYWTTTGSSAICASAKVLNKMGPRNAESGWKLKACGHCTDKLEKQMRYKRPCLRLVSPLPSDEPDIDRVLEVLPLKGKAQHENPYDYFGAPPNDMYKRATEK